LHIIIRFELEQELINDALAVADLPEAWNRKYRQYLGITPPDDAGGVLQDIHWSAGLVGYFPTYTLGNIYASQMFSCVDNELGNQDEQFANGNFGPLLGWLQDKVYSQGNCYRASELMRRVTGSEIDARPLIEHLRHKVQHIAAAT
ncbi:MAG: carboxypeptidase M32, partial [Pirellulaceae bacterium]